MAREALRRGRLAAGLAAVQLARRPGSQRLFVLLAVAVGMLSFVSAGTDVAAHGPRRPGAASSPAAPRVLTVDQADVRRLLTVTRAVDPAGAWAMAAMPVRADEPGGAPGAGGGQRPAGRRLGLAAGVRRRARRAVAAALAPPPARPFLFTGNQLVRRHRDVPQPEQQPPLELDLTFAPLAGGDVVSVAVTDLAAGPGHPAGRRGRLRARAAG